MQCIVEIPYQRFGKNYRSHLHLSTNPRRALKIGLIGCPETSVRKYHYVLRNNQEEHSSHLLRGGSLKSRPYKLLKALF